jgi:diguanylate cyclase (GGDEF)-like protein/PAS domain S-box-containing protein
MTLLRGRPPARVRRRAVVAVTVLVLAHIGIDLLATFGVLDRTVADVLAWVVLLGITTAAILMMWWALALSEAVELGEHRLALAVQAAELGMWDLDLVRGTTFNDDTCRQIYGIGHVDAAGVTEECYSSLIHPEDAAERAAAVSAFESDPDVRHHSMTFRMIRPDGRIVWVSDTGAIVRDERGRPVRKIGFSQDVTAQRELLERMSATSQRLALAAEAAGLGAWEFDGANGVANRDRTWCAIHGVDPDAVPHHWVDVLQLVHPDDRDRVQAERDAIVSSGTAKMLQYRVVRADDGRIRQVENWMTPLRRTAARPGAASDADAGTVSLVGDAGPVSLVGFVLDVTDRHRAVAQLRSSEARFRALVSNLPDTIYRLRIEPAGDAEGAVPVRLEYASPGIVRLAGLTAEEAMEDVRRVVERIHPDDRALFTDVLDMTGPIEPFVVRCVLPDGSITWSEHRCFMTSRADGSIVAIDGIARDITLTKRYEAQLTHEATHDPVTSLPRRDAFLNRLDAALAADAERSVTVLAVHVDRLSYISDVFGQSTGEALLQDAADRLRRRLRPGDLLGRTGASEFAVALIGTGTMAGTERAELLAGVLGRPYAAGGATVTCSAMVGVASSAAGRSAAGILDEARAALARAKTGRPGAVEVFEPAVLDELQRRRAVGSELQRAVEQGQLRLYVQPELDLSTGAIVGGEALVRWQNPDRGLVLPADFIPLAEQLGLERAIGRWVVDTACGLAARLRSSISSDFVLRCNLSALELADVALADHVANSLARARIPAAALCLEVTETALLADLDAALATIHRLKDVGVSLALDDFGTGYSSLVYLKRFPVDAVKIDRSFVRDVDIDGDDVAIVAATVQLAHALDRHVTAEGIETESQLRRLRELGCDTGQGYLFSRPLPIDEFEAWCRDHVGSGGTASGFTRLSRAPEPSVVAQQAPAAS